MKMPRFTLKTRALAATAGVLLLVLSANTFINIRFFAGKYREALIARTSVVADSVKKDMDKALGFGLPLSGLSGMGEQLRQLIEEDQDLGYAVVLDRQGRVLYAGDPAMENEVWQDQATAKALAAEEHLQQSYESPRGSFYEQVIPLKDLEGRRVGVFRIALKEKAVNRQTSGILMISLAVGLFSFIIATVFVYLATDKSITGPIRALSDAAGRMAAGKLAEEVAVRGAGEIAALGEAINTMAQNLRGMLGRLRQMGDDLGEAITVIARSTQKMGAGARVQQEASEQTAMTVEEMVASIKSVAENAGVMSGSAANASSAVTELATSIAEIAKNAGVLSTESEETASSIEQMMASIRQVSENAEQLSTSAEQSTTSITEISVSVKEVQQRAAESAGLAEKVSAEVSQRGLAAVGEAMEGMEKIKETVTATAEAVNRLGKRSQDIGQVLKVIDEVADQIGLLALNAAILASQAGEHGKGFAVVAEEIKDLAERTAASTQEISTIIGAVQRESQESVQAMARGLKAVESGVGLVEVTREVLEQAAERSVRSSEMARAIERSTAEQARGITQISDAAHNILDQIEGISRAVQEQRRGSELISRSAEQMRGITRKMKQATQEQTEGSRQIAESVESVTGQASQIAKATAEQRQGADQISSAMVSVQKITNESVDLSIDMEVALNILRERAEALQSEMARFSK